MDWITTNDNCYFFFNGRVQQVVRGIIISDLMEELSDGPKKIRDLVSILGFRYSMEKIYYTIILLLKENIMLSGDTPRNSDRFWESLGGNNDVMCKSELQLVPCEDRNAIDVGAQVSGITIEGYKGRRVFVLTTGSYVAESTKSRVLSIISQGDMVLLSRKSGSVIWLGPLVSSESLADWHALERRLKERQAKEFGYLKGSELVSWDAENEEVEKTLEGLKGFVLDGLRRGHFDALVTSLLTIDLFDMSMSWRTWRGAGRKTGVARNDLKVELVSQVRKYDEDGGYRMASPEDTLERIKHLVDPVVGIISSIKKVYAPAGVHVFNSDQLQPLSDLTKSRFGSRAAGAAGKGITEVQAKVSCICEAIERYSVGFCGDEKVNLASWEIVAKNAVHPNKITLFSDAQYDGSKCDEIDLTWVPPRFSEKQKIHWVGAWSLTHDCSRFIPAALCYFNFNSQPQEHVFCRSDSNGCAAGNTIEEAILQGLLELIERDACAIWWYNRDKVPEIPLDYFSQGFYREMKDYHASLDRELIVLDITADIGIPVVVAVSYCKSTLGEIHMGLGAHLEVRLAVSRALSELNQIMSIEASNDSEGEHDLWLDWLENSTLKNQCYLVPSKEKWLGENCYLKFSSMDISENINQVVSRLEELGIETIVLDCTREHIDMPVARVIAPGLRHFWPRFAKGRLYSVPVKIGRRSKECEESNLNPIPFFL
jgi:ribosomal protein S12 methylthiotransferase accessory factor